MVIEKAYEKLKVEFKTKLLSENELIEAKIKIKAECKEWFDIELAKAIGHEKSKLDKYERENKAALEELAWLRESYELGKAALERMSLERTKDYKRFDDMKIHYET